jgi:PAT family beta-lactamase induction signal transducer AmpG
MSRNPQERRLLLARHGRYYLDPLNSLPALRSTAEVLVYLLPLAGGIVLPGSASRNWRALDAELQPA